MSIKELDKFWSHGTGWIRTNDTRSFGYDNGKVINIDELSKYLPIKFDYLILELRCRSPWLSPMKNY